MIIDDLDRLLVPEVREIMRLVRLTADFPYVSYLLAYDRERVANAVTDDPAEGGAYLEKIVQLTFDVPQIREADLRQFFVEELQRTIGERELGPFDKADWQNAYNEVIAPLLKSPRDVRRVMNVLPFAFDVMKSEVAPVDVITLEVVRVTMPTIFALLPAHVDLLTGAVAPNWDRQGPSPLAPILEALPERENVVTRLCAQLFPVTRRYIDNYHFGDHSQRAWRRQRRVASPEVFRFFFEKSLPEGVLSAYEVRQVFDSLTSSEALDAILKRMDGQHLENMLGRLEDYEEEFPPSGARTAIPVLYGHSTRLREGRRLLFEFGADMALSRVVLRLIRRVPEVERTEAVQQIVSKIPMFTGRLDFIQMVGSDESIGHSLLPDQDVKPLEQKFHDEVFSASSASLAKERDLFNIVRWLYSRTRPPDAVATWLREKATDAGFLTALLRSSLNEAMSNVVGESAVRREDTLPWDFLEAALSPDGIARIDALSIEGLDERSKLAVEVAKRYREGWRPTIGRRLEEKSKQDPMKQASWLLLSGVYKQRLGAIATLHQAVAAGTAVPEDARGQLSEIVLSAAYSADERVAVVDLLLAARQIDTVLQGLSTQWLSDQGVPQPLSARISKMWFERPQQIGDLLNLIEARPVDAQGKRSVTPGVADAYANLCNMIDHDAAAVSPENILRARTIAASFASHPTLERHLTRLNTLIEGRQAT